MTSTTEPKETALDTRAYISKGARRRANRAERERLLARFRQTLLALKEDRLLEIVGQWLGVMLDEDEERRPGDWDEWCLMLGYRVVSGAAVQFNADEPVWHDLELVRDGGDSLHEHIEHLSIKELEKLSELAYMAKVDEAKCMGTLPPPTGIEFLVAITDELEKTGLQTN